MEKRVLLMVLLMTAVIMATNFLFPTPKQQPSGAAKGDSVATAAAPASAPAALPALPAGAAQAPAQQVVVSSSLYRYTFSTRGASLVGARMLRYASARQGEQVELVPAGSGGMLGHRLVVGRDTVDLRGLPFQASATRLELREGGPPQQLRFTYGAPGGLGVEVTYTFRPGDYLVDVAGRVTGTPGGTLLTRLGPGLATRDAAHDVGVVVNQGDEIERFPFGKVEGREVLAGPLSWVGVKDKYFLAAVVARDSAAPLREAVLSPLPGERVRDPGGETVVLPRLEVTAALPLGPGGAFAYSAYVGPQEHERLVAVGSGLEEVTPYGYAWLRPVVRPIASATLWVMRELHGTLGISYGWVLIIIGVLVKLLLWPLNAKATRAQMKNMAVQPLVQEIQTKYKNDPQKQQEEMIRLYKEHGFNPVAGCLPLLIPMPIFITLYFVFQNAIEFRGVSFAWLPDLSQKDPYYLIPVLFIASTFVLQWVSTKLSGMETNPQMKMMMYVMPVMMGIFFVNMASGLNLYYTASNLAGLPQQVLIARERRRAAEEMKAKKAAEEATVRKPGGGTAPATRQQKRRG
ncbi:MAG TPA: membrane protein insertase YidC [Longimicrobiaceae bacterium]|jgi:YidC/Oxa1 family membrane protein insertase